ncbi:MAG: tetratricopeptide repeat protein [Polyangiaceae bacterium]
MAPPVVPIPSAITSAGMTPPPSDLAQPSPRVVAAAVHELPPPSPSTSSSFGAEVSSLDRARTQIDLGQPAAALSLLDAYVARFPHGAMAPEATLLRIQALLMAGDHSAATRVADDFTARNPKSPYATRLHTLFDRTNP